ncbi:MAG: diadenylate cyclase CdaA [Clostridia bacterium]|nr:diadenylate cyclase CdaA [Clostridia bacterium]
MPFLENISDFFAKVLSLSFAWYDVLDILLVAFVIYQGIKLIRETRAFQLVKGLLLLALIYAVVYIIGMQASSYLFQVVFKNIFIILVIIFQQEIRKIIEHLGKNRVSGLANLLKGADALQIETEQDAIIEIAKAVQRMSDSKIGSLIVMERETPLGDVSRTGTPVDAVVTHELLGNMFFPNSPLHDGAAIIRDSRLVCAGCVLPLTHSEELSSDLGTRHRAAVGLSEVSDAVVVVTSEETGTISIAEGGRLLRDLTESSLREYLLNAMIESNAQDQEGESAIRKFFKRLKGSKK